MGTRQPLSNKENEIEKAQQLNWLERLARDLLRNEGPNPFKTLVFNSLPASSKTEGKCNDAH